MSRIDPGTLRPRQLCDPKAECYVRVHTYAGSGRKPVVVPLHGHVPCRQLLVRKRHSIMHNFLQMLICVEYLKTSTSRNSGAFQGSLRSPSILLHIIFSCCEPIRIPRNNRGPVNYPGQGTLRKVLWSDDPISEPQMSMKRGFWVCLGIMLEAVLVSCCLSVKRGIKPR